MSDHESTKPSSAEFEQQFFADAEKVTLPIDMLKETYEAIQAAIEDNSWEPQEGPLILLTLGLGYVQGRRLIEADDETRAYLADRLTNLESLAAVMKFRTYTFMKDNQVLEMRMGALRTTATGLENVVKRLQPERDAFKAEVERLQTELEACRTRLAVLEAGLPPPSWIDRLISRLKNLRKRR